MTVAIAAFTSSQDYVVTVSDARLSHGEVVPAVDNATIKSRKIANKWAIMFAAEDSTTFMPIANTVYKALHDEAEEILANHTYNESQIEWFKAGGALNVIRAEFAK